MPLPLPTPGRYETQNGSAPPMSAMSAINFDAVSVGGSVRGSSSQVSVCVCLCLSAPVYVHI
jgi:hypothetical protein